MMDRQALEKLASNPHYKMTQKQIEELAKLRQLDTKHPTNFPKHPTDFKKTTNGPAETS